MSTTTNAHTQCFNYFDVSWPGQYEALDWLASNLPGQFAHCQRIQGPGRCYRVYVLPETDYSVSIFRGIFIDAYMEAKNASPLTAQGLCYLALSRVFLPNMGAYAFNHDGDKLRFGIPYGTEYAR